MRHTRFDSMIVRSAILGTLAAMTLAAQQPGVTTTRINTVPPGINVIIDGQPYITPVAFTWPSGSKHTIQAVLLFQGGADNGVNLHTGANYTFGGWQINSTLSPTLDSPGVFTFTANPAIYDIVGTYSVAYLVRVIFDNCESFVCVEAPQGRVLVGGQIFRRSGQTFLANGTYTLEAIPNDGWIFVGWHYLNGVANNELNAYIGNSFTVANNLVNLYPRFVRTRPITLKSDPAGLRIVADRQTVVAPFTIEWGRTTTHTIGAILDQIDNTGKLWVFESWSDGGAATHEVVVPDGEGQAPGYTAKFVRGERVSFITRPVVLRLNVDGRANYQGYNFNWGVGQVHTVSAPEVQTDAQGRRYVFKSWSNGGPATQSITVPDTGGNGLTLYAQYEPETKIEITSATPGLAVVVDGASCALPCRVNRDAGVSVTLSAQATLPAGSDDSRLDFTGWGDSAALDRVITTSMEPVTLAVGYQLRHRVVLSSDPADGVEFSVAPESGDGFYVAGSEMAITAVAKKGYKFLNWEGDAAGVSPSLTFALNGPRSMRAILDRVPAITGGVRNAAGLTPVDGVAAGSIASIYGVSLAGEIAVGAVSPMTQSLVDVTVRVRDRYLPLYFVSPQQINVLIPSDLAEGNYRVFVKWGGRAEASGDFTVTANAPGLFSRRIEERDWAVAFHADGSDVTLENPAKRDEQITLLATGLGRYVQTPPDGFAVDEGDQFRVADSFDLLLGDVNVPVLYAGQAGGRPGAAAVRFRVSDLLGSGANEMRVRVNGRDSNAVLLPVE